MSVCSLCNGLLLMFNSFVNPIALESIGWKYYNVYIILLAIFLVVVYLFFAETKGRSLEDISDIFEGPAIVAGRFQRRSAQNLDMYNGDVDEDLKATTSIVEDIGK